MAYVKPGVTVKQVQTTVSPSFAPPSLPACIIGQGYYVVESTDNDNVNARLYEETMISGISYDDSGITGYLSLPEDTTIDDSSVYIDMLAMGSWKHISEDYFSVDGSANTVTISGGLASSIDNIDGASIRVGYRASRDNLNSYFPVDSFDRIEEVIGKPTTYNPLAFGLRQAMSSGSAVAAYGVTEDSTDEHIYARDALELQEVYALAPMTQLDVFGDYKAHVETMSGEYNKKERIVFLSKPWTWFASDGTTSTDGPSDTDTSKLGTATGLAAIAFGVGSKRTFYVNPDTCYVRETRPVATVKQEYLSKVHDKLSVYGLYAKFTTQWTYKKGTISEKTYEAGDDITDIVWNRLMDNTYGYYAEPGKREITVDVPVPGYYMAAVLAGMVAGQRPEQGFTNLPIAGNINKLKYSGDYFTEAQLNTMAGGGNWIMWQANQAAPIVTRHQLSTDVSSIERQELSITKSIDFAAKFIREGVRPYIGKYNITPTFLNMLKSIVVGQGAYLRREGYVNDVRVDKIEQDPVSKDTILVTISISVQYPVNYIKITLQF